MSKTTSSSSPENTEYMLIERDTRPFQSIRGCCALMTPHTRTEIRLESTKHVLSLEAVNLQKVLFVHQEVRMDIICFCKQHHYYSSDLGQCNFNVVKILF